MTFGLVYYDEVKNMTPEDWEIITDFVKKQEANRVIATVQTKPTIDWVRIGKF